MVGGSLVYFVPAWGLTLTAGQGLLVRESDGFAEWGVAGSLLFDPGAPRRGIAMQITLAWATATVGGGVFRRPHGGLPLLPSGANRANLANLSVCRWWMILSRLWYTDATIRDGGCGTSASVLVDRWLVAGPPVWT